MASSNDKDKTVQDRKNKAKAMREERKLSESDEEYELIDATDATDGSEAYTYLVTRKLLTVDFSCQSNYVQFGIGGATGWLTGYMVGKVGRAMAAAVGGSILLINMGTRAGYVTVDWEKVDNDMRSASDKVNRKIQEQREDEETKRLFDKGILFIRRNVVMVGGFAAGFFLGMAS
ncbi:FUN14 domain-containing protein 1A-like [Hydractinia symbiolongicarpus]|uniref:FUN14 domain-containing protein 1A-like n=1 Tax=Hydractinia symbiolongicarpus TaxID=13093 RepID=UPI002550C9BE|nr:FUN14 domain-containing protein 1A-like [Hydractinia symbiolongicarpus]